TKRKDRCHRNAGRSVRAHVASSARARAMNNAAALLADTARRGELHHAVILHGPSAEALRDAAIRIAKALNCLNRTTGDDCLACQRIERRIHPDVHMIEVGSERKLSSVEQSRG